MQKENNLQFIIASQFPHLTKEAKDTILNSYKENSDEGDKKIDQNIIMKDRERLRALYGVKPRIIHVKRKRHK